ncbi:Lsr2 dimerization domain-containing protein [Nocardia aurea]
MARKVVVTVVDDYDGKSQAAETVSFALDGEVYEIDLSETNAESLRCDLSSLALSRSPYRPLNARPQTCRRFGPEETEQR